MIKESERFIESEKPKPPPDRIIKEGGFDKVDLYFAIIVLTILTISILCKLLGGIL